MLKHKSKSKCQPVFSYLEASTYLKTCCLFKRASSARAKINLTGHLPILSVTFLLYHALAKVLLAIYKCAYLYPSAAEEGI